MKFSTEADKCFMDMALILRLRGTCIRRQVACILVNERGHVLATGYNGVPSGERHCNFLQCPGAKYKSGEGLDLCEAVHAEANALMQCSDISKIYVAYITSSPCIFCMRMLLNTSCKTIVFKEKYPHEQALELWRDNDRKIRIVS